MRKQVPRKSVMFDASGQDTDVLNKIVLNMSHIITVIQNNLDKDEGENEDKGISKNKGEKNDKYTVSEVVLELEQLLRNQELDRQPRTSIQLQPVRESEMRLKHAKTF